MSQRPKYGRDFPASEITVARCWEALTKLLFRDRAISQLQHDEMRRAFFIGFSECFAIMTDLSDELTEEEAAKVLERLSIETAEFHAEEIQRLMPPKGKA